MVWGKIVGLTLKPSDNSGSGVSASSQAATASRMLASSSSMVSPWLTHPPSAGASAQ